MSTRHLSDAMLAAISRGARTRAARAALTHARGCERCGALLADLVLLREHLRDDAAPVPQAALVRAFALAEPRPPRPRELAALPLARMLRDNAPELLAAGFRSGPSAREQLWRIPGADVDVRVLAQGPGSPGLLQGQVLPRGARVRAGHDGSVWLLQRGRKARYTILGQHGEFELPAPAAGPWSLCVEWRGVRTRLESR